jgi:hypothetical protein
MHFDCFETQHLEGRHVVNFVSLGVPCHGRGQNKEIIILTFMLPLILSTRDAQDFNQMRC